MYRVTVTTDGKEYPLHEPRDDSMHMQLIDPVVTSEMGKNGSFSFRIAPTHPNKGQIQALKSEILVYQDDDLIFSGRAIGDDSDFYNMGKVTCEGELAYLIDSIQRPYSFSGSGGEFLRQCLDIHNSQVEEKKQMELGTVTVADAGAELQRDNDACENTLKTLKAQLVGRSGGFLRVRRSGGKKYLDYLSDYGGINSQVIRFGENLLDLSKYTKPTGIITALIPYGATLEGEEDKPVDITSVNGGRDYIFDQAAVDTYGWIWGTQTFDDVTDPEALLSKARVYLQENIALPVTLDLKAVDMGLIDVDIQKLQLGYWTQVESVPHGISKRFMLSKKIIHLDNPGKDEVILGQTLTTFTASANKDQMQISDRIERVAASTSREINRKIENATQLITGGLGGYVVIDVQDPDTGERMHPWRILIMNTPDKSTATNVIQINQNGIGFSRTGINGPYDNAWTIDGNLLADFITAGTMLADRIRGGTMELGGTGLGRDGSIIVKDAAGNTIGSWDKTGFHVLLGVIEGSDIRGSRFTGGSIDIGNGTFSVDDDGSVVIESGEINIGPIKIHPNYANLGAFNVSASQYGIFYSYDNSIRIMTGDWPDALGKGASIILSKGEKETRMSFGSITTSDISLGLLENEYGDNWNSVSKNIIELWKRVESLENQG